MASGDTLLVFTPFHNQPPAENYATPYVRNGHPVLNFDETTQEIAIFSGILPRHYKGGGIDVYLHWAASAASSGTIGWDVAFERDGASQDLDSDSFADAKTVTAATVPAAAGEVEVTSVGFSDGAELDSLAVGEKFRLRVRRDVANDDAAGDAQLVAVEMKET